jgi:hypothetical protein
MLYKYDKKALKEEITELNSTGFTRISNHDQKKESLEILFSSSKTGCQICFYMDISPKNNNFQKKNSKVIKQGLFEIGKLNELISNFCEVYIPEKHNKLTDFFVDLKNYLESNLEKASDNANGYSNELMQIYNGLENSTNTFFITLTIHCFVILIKILVGQFGYSGEGDKPKFGDFEAQRHWMELTIYLPVKEWYTNSGINNIDYWPLDYPPMSGYHSYILGKILNKFIPDSVEFQESHGYESPMFKMVMRFFALISDVITFHLGVNLFCWYIFIYLKKAKNKKP